MNSTPSEPTTSDSGLRTLPKAKHQAEVPANILASQRRKYIQLGELVSGLLLGAFLIAHFLTTNTLFEDYGLGDRTSTYQARDGPYLTHVIRVNDEEEERLLAGWRARGKKPVCLILGYSQAHAINEMKPGEVTYSQILFERHRNDSSPIDILCQSVPNATMTEYYALFAYWQTKLPVNALILPACLDKMRTADLRPEYLQNVGISDFQISHASDSLTRALNSELARFPKQGARSENASQAGDDAGLKNTVQERVERMLNGYLNQNLPAWSHRADARGEVFTWLYLFRNSALGITSNTKRKVIPASYARNMEALESLLAAARRKNIKTLIYIPPVRLDISTPYDDQEYARFKTEVETVVERFREVALYQNLEDIVPGPYWGDLPPTDLSGRTSAGLHALQV